MPSRADATRSESEDAGRLTRTVERFAELPVLCIGDVMLDHFVYGTATRISPEAPIPVLTIERRSEMLGGAGNTVRNLISLGGRAGFIAVTGRDAAGERIRELSAEEAGLEAFYLKDDGRRSTEKSRFIAASQQLLRTDLESADPLPVMLEEEAISLLRGRIGQYRAVVLSDYGKGMLTDRVIRAAIEAANAAGIPLVVDPKRRDFSAYRGAFLLTPNAREMAEAAGRLLADAEALTEAARQQMERHDIKHMIITRGPEGMLLVEKDGFRAVSARAREVYDVSGAGDTVIATLALCLGLGADLRDAVEIANEAAGIAVSKLGTSAIALAELTAALEAAGGSANGQKIRQKEAAAAQVATWRAEGRRVGFTNGCFDLIHAGHLGLIHDARGFCDRLVVAINSDCSVRALKGPERPVNSEAERALLLAELPAVDLVVIFDEETPEALLEVLRPDVLMKGADYQLSEIVGGALVESYGGDVRRIPLREGLSSTAMIERIKGQRDGS